MRQVCGCAMLLESHVVYIIKELLTFDVISPSFLFCHVFIRLFYR